MSTILIKNPLLIATLNSSGDEFNGGHILLKDGMITSIGPGDFIGQTDEEIDAGGMVVLPGFINTHHHLYQTLTRNIPLMQDQPLFSWLTNHYEVWRELTEEAVRISTKTGLLELMKSGVTTSSDHLYIFPRKTSPALIDAEIESAMELGIRFQPTRGSMSLGRSQGGLPPDDTVQTEAEIQQDTERLLKLFHDDSDGAMTRLSLAPCSPFSVTSGLMKTTAEFAKANNLMIHTHLAETVDEEKFCLDKTGFRPAGYMDSLGWISNNSWYAHCVHLNNEEIQLLGSRGAGISHCPSSNMRLGSGIARIKEMIDAGVKVSLGVDGSASNDSGNMLLEIRNAMLLSRLREEKYWLGARDVLRMATNGGAKALGRNDIGELSVGKQADLSLFSMNHIEYAGGMSDPLAALVFSARTNPVDYLIVKGEILIDKGESKLDEAKLILEHNAISKKMIDQAKKNTGINFI
ncbi:MAG: 8-oxoguanine deaminase [Candidatus Marinimicrobia bacterium]|jgi:cytosine/adenosine deaminase-related metal-dependent hydrolase|nr:8-oxoguanine deaminase [Candidatus Neomarinimicrobiota bacterium]MBT3633744.1 8-oxoguanine deaminase [Candidatus Neomarinimicrobiota bacterium]MBT3682536.1 8-oxoguanine deaminase [Candidatus Neomarinimicrobiota bacterium]MBT3759300.1 8-oxoguanine deaminase [Candidatus Neomarinimicrobiota bacterium]MBT3894692.1 8-oxoguanine deaminase [Candidatus Neomarinimicrobiota bacterium]